MTEKSDGYQAPMLVLVGTIETLTQGHSTGNSLDKSFPVNTPSANLTFS